MCGGKGVLQEAWWHLGSLQDCPGLLCPHAHQKVFVFPACWESCSHALCHRTAAGTQQETTESDNLLNHLQFLTTWKALFPMSVCCFHLTPVLWVDRDPGCWSRLPCPELWGQAVIAGVCGSVAPATMGHLDRHSQEGEE